MSDGISKEGAKTLCHAYAGFWNALFNARGNDGLLVWTNLLNKAQTDTGVDVIPSALLHGILATGQTIKTPARSLDKIEA